MQQDTDLAEYQVCGFSVHFKKKSLNFLLWFFLFFILNTWQEAFWYPDSHIRCAIRRDTGCKKGQPNIQCIPSTSSGKAPTWQILNMIYNFSCIFVNRTIICKSTRPMRHALSPDTVLCPLYCKALTQIFHRCSGSTWGGLKPHWQEIGRADTTANTLALQVQNTCRGSHQNRAIVWSFKDKNPRMFWQVTSHCRGNLPLDRCRSFWRAPQAVPAQKGQSL